MMLVFLCSPYSGDIERNERYARAALADSLARGEAPIAPHLLYTQLGVLRDDVPDERERGMAAGREILVSCDLVAAYVDLGISKGMESELALARGLKMRVEERSIAGWR